MSTNKNIRIATAADTDAIGQLLYDFNTEYNDPTPSPEKISARLKALFAGGDTEALVVGNDPVGLALLRFRPSLWTEKLECYLAELYVKPELRGQGIGRTLMNETLKFAKDKGAYFIDLGTSEDDIAARKLYESSGFTNLERPNGPIMYVYEREL